MFVFVYGLHKQVGGACIMWECEATSDIDSASNIHCSMNTHIFVWLYCAFRSSSFAQGKNRHRFQLRYQFYLYIPTGSKCGNVPNELVHRAGLPFLDNHYCSYH